MKLFAAALASLSLVALATAGAEPARASDEMHAVTPALEKYRRSVVLGEVWKRPGLSRRDRSVVTLAALITRNHTDEMAYYLTLALENGVKPGEISELITHLAFSAGWGNAVAAIAVTKMFSRRARSEPTSSRRPHRHCFRSMRPQRQTAQARRRQFGAVLRSCKTRPTFCSATCGCGPTSRRETAALSR